MPRTVPCVDELPADAIQIKQFKGKKYDELYYSQSEDRFYQRQPRYKILSSSTEGHISARTIYGKQVRVTANAMKRYAEDIKGLVISPQTDIDDDVNE